MAPAQQKMPSPSNVPQKFARYDGKLPFFAGFPFGTTVAAANWFSADGIPILPVDDAGRTNPYPLMRVQAVAKGASATVASNIKANLDIVLPVASEADCRNCHNGIDGIAAVFAILGNLNFAPANEAWPKAKAAVEKALALDGHLAEAHAVAAMVAFWYDWDWVAAEASFNRILSLNPGDALTHGNYAWFLLNRRRFDECLHEIKVAISLDPLMPFFYAWSVGLHCATGRLDDALRDFERAIEIDPTFGLPYFHAGLTYLRKGMPDKATEVIEQGTKIAGKNKKETPFILHLRG